MAGPFTFPELRANFTPVPDVLFEVLLKSNLTREELLVTLFLLHKNYQFEKEMTLVPLEVLVAGTGLDAAASERGLQLAIERGTVLQFRADSTATPARFFLLSTEENLRVMGPIRPEVPPEVPGGAASGGMPVEFAGVQRDAAQPAKPTREARDARAAAPPEPGDPKPGLSAAVLARIAAAVGRELTKDERSRLEELDATGARLLQAVENLEARQVEIYSSDLILYEHESIRASERRTSDDFRRRAELDQAKSRQKSCKRCNGLGYIFVGVNTVNECVCRKAR